jgi:hypothetical protein
MTYLDKLSLNQWIIYKYASKCLLPADVYFSSLKDDIYVPPLATIEELKMHHRSICKI